MTIREPILAFSLSRGEAPPARRADDKPSAFGKRDKFQVGVAVAEIARASALGEGLPAARFDYAGVPAENLGEINRLVSRIKATHKRHVEAIFEIGVDLLKAKSLLGYGNFLPWLQAEFRWSERTANTYMKIAQRFEGKSALLADLDIGAAYAIANAPAEMRDEIFARAEKAGGLDRREVKEKMARRAPREGRISLSLASKLIEMPPSHQRAVVGAERPVAAFKIIDAYLNLVSAKPADLVEPARLEAPRGDVLSSAQKQLALLEPVVERDGPALADSEAVVRRIGNVAREFSSPDRRAEDLMEGLLQIAAEVLSERWRGLASELTELLRDKANARRLSDIVETVQQLKVVLDNALVVDSARDEPELPLLEAVNLS